MDKKIENYSLVTDEEMLREMNGVINDLAASYEMELGTSWRIGDDITLDEVSSKIWDGQSGAQY